MGPAAAQDETEIVRPEVFSSTASALVAQAMLDREGFLPLPEVFRFIALDGQGAYADSTQEARASLFYPGNGVVSGPSLACGTFATQFPPEFKPILDLCLQYQYPLTVFADGLHPDETTTGALALGDPSDPVSGEAVRAHAHAGIDAATTDAAMNDIRVLGLPVIGQVNSFLPVPGEPELDATLFTIDSATSQTDERIVEDGDLVSQATATLQGVRLIGGLVEIGSIVSRSVVTDDASGKKTHQADLEVSGVTVGGVPAQITEDGLIVGSPTGSGPLATQLTGVVNQLVSALNIEITALPVEEGIDESGIASARVGGVLVEFARDASGLPTVPGPTGEMDPNGTYEGSILLGATGATGIAASFEDDLFVEDDVLSDGFAPTFDDGSGTFSAPDDAGSIPDAAAPSTPEAAPGTGGGQRIRAVIDELFADRLRLLYLAFTLAALALCISPRLTLPARLPRHAP